MKSEDSIFLGEIHRQTAECLVLPGPLCALGSLCGECECGADGPQLSAEESCW